MYRPTKFVDWCQCCQQGVARTNPESSSDFLRNDNSPQVIDPSDNASSFHFVYLLLQMSQAPKAPLCKGGWQKSLISDWGIVIVDTLQSLRHGLRRATSLCTREAYFVQSRTTLPDIPEFIAAKPFSNSV